MKVRKLLMIIIGLLVILVVTIGIISIDHPIILKWITGSARHFGRSIPATIYTDGKMNEKVKIFYTDQPANYLLYIADDYNSSKATFLNLNVNEKFIGTSYGKTATEYDFIAGHLFQNKKEEVYTPIQDEANHVNFDPGFSLIDDELKLKMPSGMFQFDSVKVKFN